MSIILLPAFKTVPSALLGLDKTTCKNLSSSSVLAVPFLIAAVKTWVSSIDVLDIETSVSLTEIDGSEFVNSKSIVSCAVPPPFSVYCIVTLNLLLLLSIGSQTKPWLLTTNSPWLFTSKDSEVRPSGFPGDSTPITVKVNPKSAPVTSEALS